MARAWRIRLSIRARTDFEEIVQWTLDHFGRRQAATYSETLSAAMNALGDGPDIPGVHRCDDRIGHGYRTLHVARAGRRGRHFILFRIMEGERTVYIVRILHDAMDLARHLPPPDDPE